MNNVTASLERDEARLTEIGAAVSAGEAAFSAARKDLAGLTNVEEQTETMKV